MERLGDVVGRPELEPEHDVELGVDRAHHHHGDLGLRAETSADLDAVHPRQQHVEQHDVGSVIGEEAEALGTIGRHRDLEALSAESRRKCLAVGLFVLDHQHPGSFVDDGHRRGHLPPGP